MITTNVLKSDLIKVLEVFDYFVEEDSNSCDFCIFCGEKYGNIERMKKRGEKVTHKLNCPVLVAQDLNTRL
tara:strand:+ start:462 stop:674 length:213 start_codon:yes stop_codon:yes gene_type:complete